VARVFFHARQPSPARWIHDGLKQFIGHFFVDMEFSRALPDDQARLCRPGRPLAAAGRIPADLHAVALRARSPPGGTA
jgi:hypothetical protein